MNAWPTMVPRFSVVASLSVATIVVTRRIQRVGAGHCRRGFEHSLWNNPYSQGSAGSAAAVPGRAETSRWVRPRLRRDTASASWLRRLLIGEAALAVLVLAAVGMLTSLEPARQVASRDLAESRQSISYQRHHIHRQHPTGGSAGPGRLQ